VAHWGLLRHGKKKNTHTHTKTSSGILFFSGQIIVRLLILFYRLDQKARIIGDLVVGTIVGHIFYSKSRNGFKVNKTGIGVSFKT
jgi:hypothetical protein